MVGAETETGYCTVPGCSNEEEAGGLCFGHRYRKKHGLPMSPPLRERTTPWGRVQEAVLAIADADSENDADYHASKARLRAAAWDWLDPRGELRRLARDLRRKRRRAALRKRLPRWDERQGVRS